MTAPRRRAGEARIDKQMERLRDILANGQDIDDRLTPGQLHAAAVEALGSEPLVFVCNLLSLAFDAKSKIEIAPGEAAKIGLAVMDRIYGPPDTKVRKKSDAENTFQLEFAWTQPSGDKVTATAEGQISEP